MTFTRDDRVTCRLKGGGAGTARTDLVCTEGPDVTNPSAAKDATKRGAAAYQSWLNAYNSAARHPCHFPAIAVEFGIL